MHGTVKSEKPAAPLSQVPTASPSSPFPGQSLNLLRLALTPAPVLTCDR